jgi:exopolysaccharide production protein ExoZ
MQSFEEINNLTKHFLQGVHGLRAIAAIAVVIFHAGGMISSEKYQTFKSIEPFTRSLNTGVDIFFIISGFVISLPFFLNRQTSINYYVFNRILRIYPIAMITAFIFIASNWLVFNRGVGVDVLISSFLLIPSAADPVPVVLWTLKQELLFYMIFCLAFVWSNVGLAIVFAWAIASPFVPSENSVILSWLFHPQNVQFAFGILAAYLFVSYKAKPTSSLVIACFGLVAFGVCGAVAAAGYISELLEVILLGLFGFLTIYGIACSKIRLPSVILFVSTASYSIYLIHFFFLSLFNKVIVRYIPELPAALTLFVLVCAATFAGCCYYIIFERPIENWRKKLRVNSHNHKMY